MKRSTPIKYLIAPPKGRTVWWWRPPRWLAAHFAGVALGTDRVKAEDEARRLNRQVEAWQRAGGAQGAPQPVRGKPAALASVGEMLSRYQASRAFATLRDSTRTAARPILRMVADRWQHEQPQMVTAPAVREWLEEIRERAPGTARQVGLRFRAVWNWALAEELTTLRNPIASIKASTGRALIGAGGKRATLMGWADVQHIVAVADQPGSPQHWPMLADLLVLATLCCMRKTDALRVRRGWFYWSGGITDGHWRLSYEQSKSMVRGRKGALGGGRQIDMALPEAVATRLAGWLASTVDEPEAALCSLGGSTVAHLFAQLRDHARQSRPVLDAGATLRDARRSGFVLYKLAGTDIEWICSISGHTIEEGYEIVEHYLPKTATQADKAVALLKVAL
jgi:hypothetical protein